MYYHCFFTNFCLFFLLRSVKSKLRKKQRKKGIDFFLQKNPVVNEKMHFLAVSRVSLLPPGLPKMFKISKLPARKLSAYQYTLPLKNVWGELFLA